MTECTNDTFVPVVETFCNDNFRNKYKATKRISLVRVNKTQIEPKRHTSDPDSRFTLSFTHTQGIIPYDCTMQ